MANELVQVKGGARGFFARAAWSFEAGQQWAVIGDDGASHAAAPQARAEDETVKGRRAKPVVALKHIHLTVGTRELVLE